MAEDYQESKLTVALTVSLPANFAVWLASPEARFLTGKMVWAHWDVDEMKARADEIKGGLMLTTNVIGWPFGAEMTVTADECNTDEARSKEANGKH
jgi:hypothetical protein